MNVSRDLYKPVLILLVMLIGVSLCETAVAQVPQAHPRIWLTPAKRAELADRVARNTQAWRTVQTWCEQNLGASNSSFLSDEAYGMGVLKVANFALAYQASGDQRYADKAVSVVTYIINNPPHGGLVEWMDYWTWYQTRYALPGMALTLDWCWDAMSSADRQTIIGGLDELCNGMLTSTHTWSFHDPSNNYYYGDMFGLLVSAYAMYHHNPEAPTYLDYAKNTMLEQAMRYCKGEQIIWSLWDNNTGRAQGGMWNEGTAYGFVNTDMLSSALIAIRSVEDPNAYSDFVWPEDAVKFMIYSTYPNGVNMFAEGDGAAINAINDKSRIPMLLAMNASRDVTDPEIKNFGQAWVNAYSSSTTLPYKIFHELLWYDDGLAGADRNRLPDYHFADGSQVLVWRTGWSSGDCWMAFRIGVLNTDHGHNGLGHFIIYKDGVLAADKSLATGRGELRTDLEHNVLDIPLGHDRKLYWGASEIEHLESTPEYLYLAGDMSDVYLAQPSYRGNTVAHKEREFFLLKRELALVVMDRGTTFNPALDKVFQVYMDHTPSGSGRDFRVSNGGSDLVIHTAYPSNATGQLDTFGIPRLRVSTGGTAATKTFLHVAKVTGPGGAFEVADVTASSAQVVGTAFTSGFDIYDYLVTFSNDPEGDVPTADNYTFTFDHVNMTLRGYLLDMAPNTDYYVEGLSADNQANVTVSRTPFDGGAPYTSNAEGVVFFEVILGEDPSPVQSMSGVKIR
jgi:hypothetical protein